MTLVTGHTIKEFTIVIEYVIQGGDGIEFFVTQPISRARGLSQVTHVTNKDVIGMKANDSYGEQIIIGSKVVNNFGECGIVTNITSKRITVNVYDNGRDDYRVVTRHLKPESMTVVTKFSHAVELRMTANDL